VSINATLFVQAIVFAILVWFTMKFVWPPITKALDERAQKIADGLAAADKAKSELSVANKRVEDELAKSRNESAVRMAEAERKATEEGGKSLPPPRSKLSSKPSRPAKPCVSRSPHWPSRVPSRFCARKSMPVCMLTCWAA
jgi:hypothetical protein